MSRSGTILLCAVVGALLALALVPWSFSSDRVVSALARQIRQGYGITLDARSEVSFTLLPMPQFRLRGVRLASADGAIEAEADELRGQLRLLPVLHGHLRLRKLQLDAARVGVTLREGSAPTVGGTLARLRARLGTEPDSRWVPRIDRFIVTDAEIALRDAAGREVTRLRRASLMLDSPEPDGDLSLTAAAEWRGESVAAALSGLSLGAIGEGRADEVEGQFSGALGRGTLAGRLTWSDRPEFRGEIRGQADSIGRLVGWCGLGGDLAGVERGASITADGVVDLERIEWPRAVVEIGRDRLDGAVAVQFGPRPQVRATLAGDELDLGWLVGIVDPAGPGRLGADYDVRLSTSTLAFGPLRLRDGAISLRSGQRGVEIALGRAGFAGGSLRGRVSAGYEGDAREFRAQAIAERVDLERVFGQQPLLRGLTGVAGGQLTLDAGGPRQGALAPQLRGRVTILAAEGELAGVVLGEEAKRAPGPVPAEWRAGRLRFTQGTLAAQIADGQALITEGSFESAAARWALDGRVDLEPLRAALRIGGPAGAPAPGRPPLDLTGPPGRLILETSGAPR